MFASRDEVTGRAGRVDVVFTDRHGGVSPPPYDTLNLGGAQDCRPPDVDRNFALLARQLGITTIITMRQRHGASVVTVADESTARPEPECDGLVTSRPAVALCVRGGDCVPVVLADVDTGVVGVAHAGRRGVVAGIVAATVETMRASGASAIVGWVGPHICAGCYEVPWTMREEVAAAAPAAFSCTTRGTPAVDIGAAVTAQLSANGCLPVDRTRCTFESPDQFSYRRDGPRSGRTAGLVVLHRDG